MNTFRIASRIYLFYTWQFSVEQAAIILGLAPAILFVGANLFATSSGDANGGVWRVAWMIALCLLIGLGGIIFLFLGSGTIDLRTKTLHLAGRNWTTSDISCLIMTAHERMVIDSQGDASPVREFSLRVVGGNPSPKYTEVLERLPLSQALRREILGNAITPTQLTIMAEMGSLAQCWSFAELLARVMEVPLMDLSDPMLGLVRLPKEMDVPLVDWLPRDPSWVPAPVDLTWGCSRDSKGAHVTLRFEDLTPRLSDLVRVVLATLAFFFGMALVFGPRGWTQATAWGGALVLVSAIQLRSLIWKKKQGILHLTPAKIIFGNRHRIRRVIPVRALEHVRADAHACHRVALMTDRRVTEFRVKSDDCARWIQSEVLSYLAGLSRAATHTPTVAPTARVCSAGALPDID